MAWLGVVRGVRRVFRRWWVVLVLVACAAGLSASTAPSADDRLRIAAGSATAELVLEPARDARGSEALTPMAQPDQQLALASRVARQPEVAEAAAERNPRVDADLFADAVRVDLDRDGGSVLVTAHAGDPADSVDVADAYASAAATYIAQTTGIELQPIGTPVAVTSAGGTIPTGPAQRGALGALAGLFLGVLLAAVLPGRDGRLHDRLAAERAYGSSVLAEIPRTAGRARYAGHVAFLTRPTGTVAEAYRVLRCAVLNRGRHGEALPRVFAVTSPGRGDGRSSVARNLASALAESGRRVLLVDCDFGHPTTHYGVTMQPGTGLSDLLAAPDPGARLAEVVHQTETPGVVLLSIGTRGGREPGQLAVALPHVLAAARRLVDVVVIDSEPLEYARDALDALAMADAVLIAARPGRTSRRSAERAAALLEQCGAKVAGIALIGNGREREARTPYLIRYPDPAHTPPAAQDWEPEPARQPALI